MKRMIVGLLAVLFLSLGAGAQAQTSEAPSAQGLSLWGQIHEVLSHPRCSNCHVGADNIPIWSGPHYGDVARAHGMNVNAGDGATGPGSIRDGAGTIPCSTCHTKHNSDILHGPPGAHVWALAPVTMQWFDKRSKDICEQIKDPARNGNRTIDDVADHIGHDELVHWGWAPGPGREPAPYSADELVVFILQWDALGAPCPAQ